MPARSADLRKRVQLVGAPFAVLTIALAAFLASRAAEREFRHGAETRIAGAARRASGTANQYMRERRIALQLLASTPSVVEAARTAGGEAQRRGLDRVATGELERRFATTRALRADTVLVGFLAEFGDASDFTDVFFTERHGLNVTSTPATTDFAQADEEWWRTAFDMAVYQGAAAFDSAAGTVTVELAVQIADPSTGEPLGVMRGVVWLFRLARLLDVSDDQEGYDVAIADSTGRVILSRDRTSLLRVFPGADAVSLSSGTEVAWVELTTGPELVATVPTNRERWWVIVREPAQATFAAARSMQRTVYLGAGGSLLFVLVLIWWVTNWLSRRVTQPVRMAGAVASRVADGDLSVSVGTETAGSQEVGQLLTSVHSMVQALRKLVGQIRISAEESAAMAEEISASTEQMSASTQEMANTCQNLTGQATDQAEMVRQAAGDATRILGITSTLADGANVAAERNASLLETAEQHRERLLAGSEQLAQLAGDLEEGVAEARRLADMSEEIEAFVRQARTIAAQTNMLALNAAIEASRAISGEGRGFAVVADEVRKLANQATRAATTTSETVHNVLATLEATRDRLTRLAEASTSVRQIAESAAGGLQDVAGGAAETSAWTGEISGAAGEVQRLVEEITQRLETIATVTDSVVTAAEQIAASAQEQSASTEEIAGSAAQLAEAADRLTAAVSSFKVGAKGSRTASPIQPSAVSPQPSVLRQGVRDGPSVTHPG